MRNAIPLFYLAEKLIGNASYNSAYCRGDEKRLGLTILEIKYGCGKVVIYRGRYIIGEYPASKAPTFGVMTALATPR